MKVRFRFGIKTYSGTVDEMVYGSYRKHHLCIGREYIYPTLNLNHHLVGTIAKNLASVYRNSSVDYLADLKEYARRNGSENIPYSQMIPTAFALFVRMMYAWYDSDPEHVDLSAVTVADIVSLDADVKTIARAVDAEFLPLVSTYVDLTSAIQ